jgi:uncharacterized membrane protein YbhN (UPF0104 family)
MRRKHMFFLGFVLLILSAYLFLPREFDSRLFWVTLRETRPWWIAGSVAATFLGYAVRALRWQALLSPLKRIDLAPLLTTTMIGFGAIFTLGRPGEVVRPVWISRQEGLPTMGAVASIVVERAFDMLMLLLLFALASPWIELRPETREALGGLGTPWQLIILVVVSITGFMILHRYAPALARIMPFDALKGLMQTFAYGLAETSTPAGFATVAGYSMLLWTVHTLQFWLMLEGLGLSYPLAAAMLTLVLTSLGSIAQVPGIGGGFQAGFILSATALLGTPTEVAVAASLVVWFITTVPTVVVASGYMMWKGISIRDLREEETGIEQTVA